MTDEPFMKLYREEYISTFEQRFSLMRVGCVPEFQSKGNQAEFLVSGSGSATAVTRGSNGKIPYGETSNSQLTCTLLEKHGPFERTGFNIFASQGNQRQLMMQESIGVINRDIDDVIIAQLDTGTQTTGAAVTASMDLVTKAQVILGVADVDLEEGDQIFAAISPAFRGYLEQTTEYSSGDYVDTQPLAGGPKRKLFRWNGVNWIVSNRLTGAATSSEDCFMWHRNSMGHAANMAEMAVHVGYEDKQDTSWTRGTLYHGAKLLQNTGIVKMIHDGSAYVAS